MLMFFTWGQKSHWFCIHFYIKTSYLSFYSIIQTAILCPGERLRVNNPFDFSRSLQACLPRIIHLITRQQNYCTLCISNTIVLFICVRLLKWYISFVIQVLFTTEDIFSFKNSYLWIVKCSFFHQDECPFLLVCDFTAERIHVQNA